MSSPVLAPEVGGAKGADRYRRILAAAMAGAAGKGVVLIVNATVVPIALRSLGAKQYGILVTITASITMSFVLDLGIANTLTNLISEAYARNDRALAARYFTTAFWAVLGVVCMLGFGGLLVWPLMPWMAMFHVADAEIAKAFAWVGLICLAALPAGLAPRIMAGYQEVHASNLFTAAGSLLSLACVAGFASLHLGLAWLAAAFAVGPVAGNAACLIWICLWRKPWMTPWPDRFCFADLPKIFRSGILFFASQLAALVVLNSDNLVISHYLGPSEVTPYNVTWRLTSFGSALLALVTSALWPAYTEAYLRGDRSWMRKTYALAQRATALSLTIVAMILAFAGKTIIHWWAGPSAVPSTILLNLMCVWMVVFAITMNQGSLMGATGRVGRQAVSALLAAAVNLALSIWWVQSFGVTGVILGTLVSYLVFLVGFQELQVREILYGPSRD
jgi:O-antigen/teichoic acid export membrane protein